MRAAPLTLAAVCVAAGVAHGQTALAEWTFEASVPVTAGPHVAEGGVVAAGAEASGLHQEPGAAYSNPVGNGSAESFSSNNWAAGDYYQFRVQTTGYGSITVVWDQARSSTGPAQFDAEWSLDGQNFTTFVEDYMVLQSGGSGAPGTWTSTPPSNPLFTMPVAALPPAADDQPAIWVRLRAGVAGSSTAGTNRIDNVIIAGSQVPTSCYPDCDGDSALTLADFGCFQTEFALGNMYADCNGDSVLNLADFGCFQTAFALGCR